MSSPTQKAERIAAQALKLRAVRKKHAARVANFAGIMRIATRALMNIEAEIREEAIAIAGEGYENVHTVTFELYGGSIDEQLDHLGEVQGPGLKDLDAFAEELLDTANGIVDASV
jgi:hypothetical protein